MRKRYVHASLDNRVVGRDECVRILFEVRARALGGLALFEAYLRLRRPRRGRIDVHRGWCGWFV